MTIPSLEHHTSTWQKYIVAGIVTILFFAICSLYLFFSEGSFDVGSINSAAAGTSFLLIALILLIGPLTRLYQIFDKWMMYRKELGVLAFLLALYHSIYSLIYLPFVYRASVLPSTIMGIVAVLVLSFLFIISRHKIIARLKMRTWWKMQYWGVRIAGVLILLHVIILKWNGWTRLYASEVKDWPPASLVFTVLGTFVLLVRLIDVLLPVKIARIAVPVLLGVYILVISATMMWL